MQWFARFIWNRIEYVLQYLMFAAFHIWPLQPLINNPVFYYNSQIIARYCGRVFMAPALKGLHCISPISYSPISVFAYSVFANSIFAYPVLTYSVFAHSVLAYSVFAYPVLAYSVLACVFLEVSVYIEFAYTVYSPITFIICSSANRFILYILYILSRFRSQFKFVFCLFTYK